MASALVRLAAQVLDRNENEFQISAGFVNEGSSLHVRYGVHIDLPGSDAASRNAFKQAVGHFAHGILEKTDHRTIDFFQDRELPEKVATIINAQVSETLQSQNGKKLKAPMSLIVDGMVFCIAGRYREAPPPVIDRTPFEVIGRLEGVERTQRKFTVLMPGVRERLQRINFDLDLFLETFRTILCDDQAYRFKIHMDLDARLRPIAIVDNVSKLDSTPFALTP